MRHGFVKVAAATPHIRVADPMYNAGEIIAFLKDIYKKGANVIVFPELCVTGYTCGDLFLQDTLLNEALIALEKIVSYTDGHDALVFVGLPICRDGRLYNVAVAIQDGRVLGIVPKSNIPTYGEYYEGRYFTEGNKDAIPYPLFGKMVPFGTRILFECAQVIGFSVGCEICEDLWVANPPSTEHALAGAQLIVNLSASNETVGKDSYRRLLVKATSGRLISGYVYASAGVGESTQDVVYGGHNLIAENGSLLEEADLYESGVIYADIDLSRLNMERRRMGTFGREPKSLYQVVAFEQNPRDTQLTRYFSRLPFVPGDAKKLGKRCEEILAIQTAGLCKRYEHTGSKCAVIGISGGLDSTLALLVTVRAFDRLGLSREGIMAVTMPCFGTTNRTYENACKLSTSLGVTLKEVDIKDSVLSHFMDIGQDPEVTDVTYENGQARERTQVLMDLANKNGGLVIGTGDLSELALGWATYNGDHMSMYGVNSGVPKTLVRHLVSYIAKSCDNSEEAVVLEDILATPVSPELLPPTEGEISQKTEDLVGPYELHDFFLYYMLRMGYSPDKIYRIACSTFKEDYDKAVILKWLKSFYKRFFAQQFKRSCLPDGPKVGSVAVSPRGDLRMPSDAVAAAWLRSLEDLQ